METGKANKYIGRALNFERSEDYHLILKISLNLSVCPCAMMPSHLSKAIVSDGYKVISGFGIGIGSSVINGALDEIFLSKYKHINE